MQSISLVPSPAHDNSIYIADRKNCNGGLIVLEEQVTDYYMDVQQTTSVSVDVSLLNFHPNSTIQFNLIVYSTRNNVLNLSGFNVDQIQVLNGQSVFSVMKGIGDINWNIRMISSNMNPEQRLVCYTAPFVPTFNSGVFNIYNFAAQSYDNMFSEIAVGQQTSNTYGEVENTTVMTNGYICAKFPMPVWLTTVSISRSTDANYGNERFPNYLQVFASNDGETWTQILNTSLDNSAGAVNVCTCTSNNYYTFFKFKYLYPINTSSTYFLPPIALMGFSSELIGTGTYSIATPSTNVLPANGYNIEVNSADMSSVGDIYKITNFNQSGGYNITYAQFVRIDNSKHWEFIYTFPEAVRTVGLIYKLCRLLDDYWEQLECIKLFSLSYSDDKSTWTEYCRIDGTLDVWNSNLKTNQIGTYFIDSISEHRYYKITIYSLYDTGQNTISIQGLGLLKYQKGHYFNFESFIPKLSSNSQGGYMLMASNSNEGDAYKLFDQSLTSYGGGEISNGEWTLVIKLAQSTVVRGLEMVSPPEEYNRMPYAFSIQGSQDNDTWTNIKTFLLGSNYWNNALQIGQWDIENNTAYLYYRLVVTNTANGEYVRIGELGLSSYASFKGINWYEDEYLVPLMSSNSQDGYIASAKSQYSDEYAAWQAFDRNSGDCWACSDEDITNSNKECDVWLQIQLPTAKIFNGLNIVSRESFDDQAPSSFVLKGSNNGETWNDLLEVTDEATYSSKTWNITNSTAYSYYRIYISKTNRDNDHVSIAQLNLTHRTYHDTFEGE